MTNHWVLTAAHCFDFDPPGADDNLVGVMDYVDGAAVMGATSSFSIRP